MVTSVSAMGTFVNSEPISKMTKMSDGLTVIYLTMSTKCIESFKACIVLPTNGCNLPAINLII